MLKVYIATTQVAININFEDGSYKHIAFEPKTKGGSVYYSRDEKEQAAIESHYKFGSLFKLSAVETEAVNAENQTNTESSDSGDGQEGDAPQKVHKEIRVNDIAEAKDYLCEKFGLSRTKLRSTKAITDAAQANGIVFIGI